MNKEPTTYGLNREKVVRILRIGSEKEELEHEPFIQENTAELLQDQLAQPFGNLEHHRQEEEGDRLHQL